MMRSVLVAIVCAAGLLAGTALAQLAADMKLEDAGFVMRRADTAKKLSDIKRVPPHRFVARVKNGKRYYVYADPEICQCVFVGNDTALQAFRDMRARPQQPDAVPPSGVRPEAILVQDMDSDLSDMIGDDSILDWNL